MKNTWRIACNTFADTLREPVYALMLAAALLLIYHYPAAAVYVFFEQVKMVTDSSMATILLFSMLGAALSAGATVSREMRNGTVLLLLSKPISKTSFVIGKISGIIAATLFSGVVLAAGTMISLRIATDQFRFDFAVFIWSLLLIVIAAGGALAANFLTGSSFPQVFSLLLFPLVAAEAAVLLIFSGHLDFAVWEVGKALILLLLSLPVAAALAAALAVRYDTVPVLCIMTLIFLLGMMSDYLFGRSDVLPQAVSEVLYAAIPAWQLFWMADAVALGNVIPGNYIFSALLYTLLYITLITIWAFFLFRGREAAGSDRN